MSRAARIVLLALTALLVAGPVAQAATAPQKPRAVAAKPAKAAKQRRLTGVQYLANGGFESSLSGWYGWNANLSRVAGGATGAYAARVSSTTSGSFSITSAPKPVTSTVAGGVYTTSAAVRSDRPGSQLCLRIREWNGGTFVAASLACLTSTTSWQRFPALAYTARGSGRQLDVYVYDTAGANADRFDVDDFSLTDGAAAPAPAPAPTFTVAGSPASATVEAGAAASYTVSVGAQDGFTGTVTLAAAGLPAGATASFSTAAPAAPGSSTLTVRTSATTPAGSYTVTVAGTASGTTKSATVSLGVTAPAPTPAPSSLVATAVDHAHVRLDWPLVAGAATYRVARGTLVLGTTAGATYTDALLWPGTAYGYTVTALDAAGATVSTQTASAATTLLPAAGFPRPFASTSFWNTTVAGRATSAKDAGMMSYFLARVVNPNFTIGGWAVSVAEAQPGDPLFTVPCTMYSCTLGAFGAFRIPATAKPDPQDDGHLAVYDPATQREWGLWQAKNVNGAWSASAGAAVSMLGDGVAPAGTAGADAANFPLLGGLVRPEEIAQGRIDHALVFGMPGVGAGRPVCPATHNAGSSSDPNALREGQLLRLDPSVDVDALALPAWQKTIARALQTYGMYLRDGAGALGIYGENTIGRGYDAWAKVGVSGGYPSLAGIPWSKLHVLDAPDC